MGAYDIASIRNPAIKELFRLRVGGRRARAARGVCLVHGKQLVQSIGEFFKFREVYTHEAQGVYNADRVVRVQKTVLQHVLFGPKEEPAKRVDDDAFVIGKIDHPQPVEEFDSPPKWLLAIDKIKHPENMGLLLSTAVALKFDGVVFNAECVDPFSYKVLDASQAVAWTLPYRYATSQQLLELSRRHGLLLCAGSTKGRPLQDLPTSTGHRGFCLVVGSEAEGVQKELLQHCEQVSLPMSELVESLNAGVAGGILMHSLTMQLGGFASKHVAVACFAAAVQQWLLDLCLRKSTHLAAGVSTPSLF
ncbi:unnamed protein product [Effrenium voratum]|uniref:tRNA/rRNA methyltransferase SpoU type domain-containing protein n=1 Tax=Effrenium voratum TaxID=2562239 RepID=A0AA36JRC0_9DINO|nr:unnamed protein product [Effrenium voratum]CAJ1441112.1 unnamed protein product [Effrenium voratum]